MRVTAGKLERLRGLPRLAQWMELCLVRDALHARGLTRSQYARGSSAIIMSEGIDCGEEAPLKDDRSESVLPDANWNSRLYSHGCLSLRMHFQTMSERKPTRDVEVCYRSGDKLDATKSMGGGCAFASSLGDPMSGSPAVSPVLEIFPEELPSLNVSVASRLSTQDASEWTPQCFDPRLYFNDNTLIPWQARITVHLLARMTGAVRED